MSLEVSIKKKLSNFTLEMDFEAGEGVLALLGASGCGKSMTLKCIAGIERPDSGRIVLDGRVLFDSSKKIDLPPQKRRIGYMFQDYALFPNMTVRKNVMAGMGKHPDPAEVDDYLRRFRIFELAEQYPTTLSGGQKQRAAMARLVAQKPDVILLDEPFSALDSTLRSELEHEMKEVLSSLHRPTVFVSHSRDEVFHLSSVVCCMNEGRSQAAQPVYEFFKNPKTSHAARLSGCRNVAAARIIDAHHLAVDEWGMTFAIRREIPSETAYVGIRAHDFRVTRTELCDNEFTIVRSSALEDLFEWTVLCAFKEGSTPVQWKITKELMSDKTLPDRLYLDSDSVMLLR